MWEQDKMQMRGNRKMDYEDGKPSGDGEWEGGDGGEGIRMQCVCA